MADLLKKKNVVTLIFIAASSLAMAENTEAEPLVQLALLIGIPAIIKQ